MRNLSQRFSLDLVLTQLDDFSIVLLSLINTSLIVFLIPAFVLQTFFFCAPAFFTKEKIQVSLLLCCVLVSFFFSFILVFLGFVVFYSNYSTQLLSLNLDTSTKILVDFKKIFGFVSILVTPTLLFFLPLNFFIVFFFCCGFLRYNGIKISLFFFITAYLLDFLGTENVIQLLLLFFIQFFQLEFLFLLNFILFNAWIKNLFYYISLKKRD